MKSFIGGALHSRNFGLASRFYDPESIAKLRKIPAVGQFLIRAASSTGRCNTI